jgi:hypothetical protein
MSGVCDKAPGSWQCTRAAGHDGPCAAVPAPSDDKVLQCMRMVMKSARIVALQQPHLGIDPDLPLLRKEHPEWFEENPDDAKGCKC